MKIKVLELFGGISSPHKALLNLGFNIETIDYVEFDKKTIEVRNKLYGTNYEAQSVINYNKEIKNLDLLVGGSPCQDFSIAGIGKGGEKDSGTRSSLIWEQLRLLEKYMPKFYIWENVKGVLNKNHIHIFNKHNEFVESLGYKVHYKVLNAKEFGIPQNRQRVFVIAIRNDLNNKFNFDNLEKTKMKSLKSFLSIPQYMWYWVKQGNNQGLILEHKNFINWPRESDGKLINGSYNRAWKQDNYVGAVAVAHQPKILEKKINNDLLVIKWNDKLWNVRVLTERECWLLMGFTNNDFDKVKDFPRTQLYKNAGNSIVVQVLEAIFKELLKEKE